MTDKTLLFKLKSATLVKRQRSSQSVHLDAIRGLAAVAVALSHVRMLFFVDYEAVRSKNTAIKCLYMATGLGHSAVIVFFVLSGYFISASVLRTYREKRWTWREYIVNRLARLYTVLAPAMLLCALWDNLGIRLFGCNSVYGNSAMTHSAPICSKVDATTWFGNLFYLQGITVPVYGSNSPLWSLSYEFWYYLLFPALLFALGGAIPWRQRLGYALFAVATLFFIGKGVALNFLIWLMGFEVFILRPVRILGRGYVTIGAIVLFVLTLIACRFHVFGETIAADFLLSASFSALLISIVNGREQVLSPIYEKIAVFLSKISYTLYLVHFPILCLLSAILVRRNLWQPNLPHLGAGLLIMGMVLVYTLLVWRLTEANTDAVKRAVTAYLSRRFEAKPGV